MSLYRAHYLLDRLRGVFVLDLELCTSVKLVIDLKLSLVERFVLLIQRPLLVCNWPWFGRTVTGQFRIGAERFALKVHSFELCIHTKTEGVNDRSASL